MDNKIKKIAGVFVLASIISYFLIQSNEKQFNSSTWKTSPLTRYTMTKDITESNMLIGKTKDAVILLLGNATPSALKGREHLVYSLGKSPSFFETKEENLVVIFENALVVKVIHSYE